MKKRVKIFNILLTIILTMLVIGMIFKNRYSHNLEVFILGSVVVIYLFWAFAYHKMDKSLTLTNYLEYVLTATLALILLMGVLF